MSDDRERVRLAIDGAVGGAYEMPDGRSFWIDGATAREITRRVQAALAAMPERWRPTTASEWFCKFCRKPIIFGGPGLPLTITMQYYSDGTCAHMHCAAPPDAGSEEEPSNAD